MSTEGLLFLPSYPSKRLHSHLFLMGLLLGFLFGVRFQLGIWIAVLGLLFLVREGIQKSVTVFLGLVLGLILVGYLDFLTWGSWFHSVVVYLKFNFSEGGSTRDFGTQPWHKLFFAFGRYFGFPNLPIFFGLFGYSCVRYWKQVSPYAILFLVYFGVHLFIGHKEDRFVIPVVPYFFLVIAIGCFQFYNLKKRAHQIGLVIILGTLLVRGAIWDWGYHWNRVTQFVRLAHAPEVRGVVHLGPGLGDVAGLFYFQSDKPLLIIHNATEVSSSDLGTKYNAIALDHEMSESLGELLKKFQDAGAPCVRRPDWGRHNFLCNRTERSNN